MVNLKMIYGIWYRTSSVRHRLSSAAAVLQKSRNVHNLRRREFLGNDTPYDSRTLFTHSLPGTVAERSFTTTNSWLAKSKSRGKDNKKPTKVKVNLNELSNVINVEKVTGAMEEAVTELKNNYAKNLTLRSSIGSIEQISVTWEEKEYELQELSQIARKPNTLVINASAFPQVIPNILQAIAKSGMNLNPQQDGTTLFVPIPKVTKEHRESLAKGAKATFISCRDKIKDIQLRTVKSLKNNKSLSEDLIHHTQDQLRTLADEFVDEAEAIFKTKLKELLGDSN